MRYQSKIATSKTPRNDQKRIAKQGFFVLRQKILHWYRQNKRDLPWRKTRDPYAVLVSEVMLQQTQVDRVIPKYHEFLKRFPSIETLAHASLGDVLRIWSGLGYNRRAKYLKKMAEMVMNGYKGQIPHTYDALRTLPGTGDYTANAVLCFAFKKKAAAVDTNVRNVIENEFGTKNVAGLRDPNIRMHPNAPNSFHSENSDANPASPELPLRQVEDEASQRGESDHSDRSKQSLEATSLSLSRVKQILLQLMPQDHPDEFLHALMDYSALRLRSPLRRGFEGRAGQARLAQPDRKKGYTIPFKQSNRYLRGLILARLTHHAYHSKKLISAIQKETQRSQADIIRALGGLLKENLITRSRGLLHLPSEVAESPHRSPRAPATSGSSAR